MRAASILQKVKRDYTAIAYEFDVTRQRSWPEFEEFVKATGNRQQAGETKRARILDVGCGNGRLFDFLKKRDPGSEAGMTYDYTGLDNNKKFLSIAKKKYPEARFVNGDILSLPFPAHSFDEVWCIAVVHHIPTKTLQRKALRELRRVLKKGGTLMLTVWNIKKTKYQRFMNAKTHTALIPWGIGEKKVHRYYHVFDEKELRILLATAGFGPIKKIKSAHNIALLCYEKSKNS